MNVSNNFNLTPHETIELHELLTTGIVSAKKLKVNMSIVQDSELKTFMQDSLNSKKFQLQEIENLINIQQQYNCGGNQSSNNNQQNKQQNNQQNNQQSNLQNNQRNNQQFSQQNNQQFSQQNNQQFSQQTNNSGGGSTGGGK